MSSRRFRTHSLQEIVKRIRMLADFEQHMKNIEDDVSNNSRNLTDIIDNDLKFVVRAKQSKRSKQKLLSFREFRMLILMQKLRETSC